MTPFSSVRLLELLARLGEVAEGALVVGTVDVPIDGATHCNEAALLASHEHQRQYPVGVCIDPAGSEILAYMRDVACETSVAIQNEQGFTASEFLALGYQRLETPREAEFSVWLHTPEVTDRPREWNNADQWAHPENFDKQRW